jgi:hypothetical protein
MFASGLLRHTPSAVAFGVELRLRRRRTATLSRYKVGKIMADGAS